MLQTSLLAPALGRVGGAFFSSFFVFVIFLIFFSSSFFFLFLYAPFAAAFLPLPHSPLLSIPLRPPAFKRPGA
jgi:hypothetical protein